MPQTLSAEWKAELSRTVRTPRDLRPPRAHARQPHAHRVELETLEPAVRPEAGDPQRLRAQAQRAARGATSWGVDEIEARGRALAESATALWSAPIPGVVTPHAGFDWGQVDQAVNSLPAGSWTSYGDLAELAGTAAQPTANHVAKDPAIKYAYRVLGGDGSVSFNFQWHDESDTRDPIEVLIGEGIEFDEHGRASQTQRLGPAELEDLLEAEPTSP